MDQFLSYKQEQFVLNNQLQLVQIQVQQDQYLNDLNLFENIRTKNSFPKFLPSTVV